MTYRGIDGSLDSRFKNKDDALTYVLARAQWWTSAESGHSDFAHYDLHGFGYSEWKEKQA